MRRVPLLVVIILAVSLLVAATGAQPVDDLRAAAQAHHEARAFAEAAALWAQVAAAEPAAVDARINAAHAYLQANDLGHAMLFYRRAQALDPRHGAVQHGLALVRALRVDTPADEAGFLPAVERLTVEIVSMAELSWLVLSSWTLAFVLVALAVFWPRLKPPAACTGVLAGLLLVLLLGRGGSLSSAPPAVVTAFEAVLYNAPDAASVPLSRVYAAAEVRIGAHQGDWTLITLPDGRMGWVTMGTVAPVEG